MSEDERVTPVDLKGDGVLWMVNCAVFHPRGLALAVDEDGELSLVGDGKEPWQFDAAVADIKFAAFNALVARQTGEVQGKRRRTS